MTLAGGRRSRVEVAVMSDEQADAPSPACRGTRYYASSSFFCIHPLETRTTPKKLLQQQKHEERTRRLSMLMELGICFIVDSCIFERGVQGIEHFTPFQ